MTDDLRDRRDALLRLLAAYSPADPDEISYRLRMLDLAAVAHDPFDRHDYALGHFTASGFVIHPAGDRVLLVHHRRLDRWVQPGGHVDPGDAGPLAAAQREVAEETGVTDLAPVAPGLVDADIHEYPAAGEQPRHLHFDLRFGFVARSVSLRTAAEVHECRWVRRQELEALGVDRSILRPVGRLLGDL